MVVNTALDFISQGDAYVFNRPGDLWTLSEHSFKVTITMNAWLFATVTLPPSTVFASRGHGTSSLFGNHA